MHVYRYKGATHGAHVKVTKPTYLIAEHYQKKNAFVDSIDWNFHNMCIGYA